MEVMAHKDSVTGRLFESKEQFDQFQEEQRKVAEAATRRELLLGQLADLKRYVPEHFETPSDLAHVVTAAYTKFLDISNELVVGGTAKRPKRQPLKLTDVSVSRIKITAPGIREPGMFSAYVRVTLSEEPMFRTNKEGEFSVYLDNVLAPLALGCGGASSNDDGTYEIRSELRAPLSKLPRLAKRLETLAELYIARSEHLQRIENAAAQVAAADEEHIRLADEAVQATQLAQEALRKAEAAREAVERHDAELTAQHAAENPFNRQSLWEAATAGFEGQLDEFSFGMALVSMERK